MREQFHMQHTVIIACTSNPAKVGKELMDAGVDFVWPKPPPLPTVIKMKINMLLETRLKKENNLISGLSVHSSHGSAGFDEKSVHRH